MHNNCTHAHTHAHIHAPAHVHAPAHAHIHAGTHTHMSHFTVTYFVTFKSHFQMTKIM